MAEDEKESPSIVDMINEKRILANKISNMIIEFEKKFGITITSVNRECVPLYSFVDGSVVHSCNKIRLEVKL